MAIVDVDDLKYFNDALGHAAGDSLLRAVAASLDRVRGPNEFLARFGGDEFALLLEAPTEEAVRSRLAALLRAVRERESRVPARASAGRACASTPDTGSTDEELIVAADIALHEAKERGGDRYTIFEGSGHRAARLGRPRARGDRRRAAAAARPADLRASPTGTEIGCEVLVRMLEPDGSVLSPAAFLPTAERFGLIPEIDCWVAERAIELATQPRAR